MHLQADFKRAFDLIFSLFALLLSAPLFLLITLTIKACSPGPAIYSQYRLGKSGIPFKCYKFRTMHLNAEQLLSMILQKDQKSAEEWKQKQKLTNDPRVFSLGTLLRKYSLDEIPQFYNVLKGDLSIVGPRPYMPSQLSSLEKKKKVILSVKPGITGLWQTSGRSSTTFKRRVYLDAKYVAIRSFWFDLILIIKTCKEIFNNKNAY